MLHVSLHSSFITKQLLLNAYHHSVAVSALRTPDRATSTCGDYTYARRSISRTRSRSAGYVSCSKSVRKRCAIRVYYCCASAHHRLCIVYCGILDEFCCIFSPCDRSVCVVGRVCGSLECAWNPCAVMSRAQHTLICFMSNNNPSVESDSLTMRHLAICMKILSGRSTVPGPRCQV